MDPATQVVGAVGAGAKELAKGVVNAIVFGSFNPDYNKDDQKRMRYIQQKYAQAYGTKGAEDPETTIKTVDPNSRLLMTSAGRKPSNPFPHERSFEESLQMTFHPLPGHEGRFAASHAMACIGKITEYQVQRRKRTWIPGVQTPGRPNDYVNLFLDEMKVWLRTQLTLNMVVAEEIQRREVYITKLKHDNYYWCFPLEPNHKDYAIHDVIDFVHNKVLDALEVVQREEKNKSLQTLFKELNDHTTNAFEYGKNFLAYLLTATKKAGADLTSSNRFDGDTYETGRLHRLLEKNTDPVMKMYVADIRESDKRIEAAAGAPAGLLTDAQEPPPVFYKFVLLKIEDGGLFGPATFIFSMTDPKSNTWVLRKRYADFEAVLKEVCLNVENPDALRSSLPPKLTSIIKPTAEELQARAEALVDFMVKLLEAAADMQEKGRRVLCEFFDVKSLYDPPTKLVHAETIPNTFMDLKKQFLDLVMSQDKKNQKETDKVFGVLKAAWGIDATARILEAHALLQRMATLLGLTLEINHFFVSMFGNTLAFSKLPLRDLLMTLKDIMGNFLALASDLFKHACQLNADQKYNWHKNLQVTENELGMVKHHIERALVVISKIDTDHLDYEAQLRRLQDVTQRFTPLLCRLDNSLPMIQSELNLPTRVDLLTDDSSSSRRGATPLLLDSRSITRPLSTSGMATSPPTSRTPVALSRHIEEVGADETLPSNSPTPTSPSITTSMSTSGMSAATARAMLSESPASPGSERETNVATTPIARTQQQQQQAAPSLAADAKKPYSTEAPTTPSTSMSISKESISSPPASPMANKGQQEDGGSKGAPSGGGVVVRRERVSMLCSDSRVCIVS